MASNNSYSDSIKFHIIENHEKYEDNVKFVNKIRQVLAGLLAFIHYAAVAMVGMFGIHLIIQLRKQNIEITADEASWIASAYILPMCPICIFAGLLMQRIPKRNLLTFSFIVEISGWMLQYIYGESSIMTIIIGRIIIGAAIAVNAPIIPLYIAEVTHPKQRGIYISAVFMGLSFGFMFGNIICSSFTWKSYILISVLLTLISLIITYSLEETYVWHMKKNDKYKTKESFYYYRGRTEEAKKEITKYIADHSNTRFDETQASFFSDFKTNIKLLALPLLISVTMVATMHLSGYKIIIIYSIHILGAILPSANVYIITITMDAFRLISNILACILIKRYPVRLLFITSGIASALSLGIFCILKYFAYLSEELISMLCLVPLAIFIVFATFGIASLPWVVCGEIFPLEVKNVGSGTTLFINFAIFFITIKYAPLLQSHVGVIGEFVFFCCCTTIGTIIIYIIMPETKNKTLGDIENAITKTK